MAIHEVDGHFVISTHGTWLPGAFETRKAASLGLRLDDLQLAKLRAEAIRSSEGIIREESVQRLYQELQKERAEKFRSGLLSALGKA